MEEEEKLVKATVQCTQLTPKEKPKSSYTSPARVYKIVVYDAKVTKHSKLLFFFFDFMCMSSRCLNV